MGTYDQEICYETGHGLVLGSYDFQNLGHVFFNFLMSTNPEATDRHERMHSYLANTTSFGTMQRLLAYARSQKSLPENQRLFYQNAFMMALKTSRVANEAVAYYRQYTWLEQSEGQEKADQEMTLRPELFVTEMRSLMRFLHPIRESGLRTVHDVIAVAIGQVAFNVEVSPLAEILISGDEKKVGSWFENARNSPTDRLRIIQNVIPQEHLDGLIGTIWNALIQHGFAKSKSDNGLPQISDIAIDVDRSEVIQTFTQLWLAEQIDAMSDFRFHIEQEDTVNDLAAFFVKLDRHHLESGWARFPSFNPISGVKSLRSTLDSEHVFWPMIDRKPGLPLNSSQYVSLFDKSPEWIPYLIVSRRKGAVATSKSGDPEEVALLFHAVRFVNRSGFDTSFGSYITSLESRLPVELERLMDTKTVICVVPEALMSGLDQREREKLKALHVDRYIICESSSLSYLEKIIKETTDPSEILILRVRVINNQCFVSWNSRSECATYFSPIGLAVLNGLQHFLTKEHRRRAEFLRLATDKGTQDERLFTVFAHTNVYGW